MQTECSADLFGFARAGGREVVAAFDGGMMTSEAGALLLGATGRVIGLTRRFAACFQDARNPASIRPTQRRSRIPDPAALCLVPSAAAKPQQRMGSRLHRTAVRQ